jgi:hypothetical protein
MKKKIVLVALASMFLLSAVIGSQLMVTAAALTRVPGVSPDQWYWYSFTYSGNATMPPANETMEWANATILTVSGTNVTFKMRLHYADGHENASISILNVDTGQGNGTGILIAANLNAGDLIYTSPPTSGLISTGATINETISRTYSIGTLEVNHLNITKTYTYPGFENFTVSENVYWGQTTGMLTEMSIYELIQRPSNMTWSDMDAVIANVSVIPEFPPALILPLFMIATIAAVWLGKAIWSTKKLTRKTFAYA